MGWHGYPQSKQFIYRQRLNQIVQELASPDNNSSPIVRFSEFLGIGYFGDSKQKVISPIFDLKINAQSAWAKVMESQAGGQGSSLPVFHAIFIEHPNKYEFLAHPIEIKQENINYVLYRSFSSLDNFYKFRENQGEKFFIKFGWQDITKAAKFDVLEKYALVDGVEFKKIEEIRSGSLVDRIRKNQ